MAGAVRYAVHLSKATCVASSFFCEHERTGFGVSANLTCSGISASGRAAGPRESRMFSFARNCHLFFRPTCFVVFRRSFLQPVCCRNVLFCFLIHSATLCL